MDLCKLERDFWKEDMDKIDYNNNTLLLFLVCH